MPAMILTLIIITLSRLYPQAGPGDSERYWVDRHRIEDAVWARRTGLRQAEIRELRLGAGVADELADVIDLIDARSFRDRGHILVVTAGGNGHCLGLFVFRTEAGSLRQVWSAEGTPGGAGFCRESPVNPSASISRGGKIAVRIPVYDYKAAREVGSRHYVYKWDGVAYRFVGVERRS